MRYAIALVMLLWVAAPASAADPNNLRATGRTDTQLHLQWDGNGHTLFTVDYLGPSYFGGNTPTCSDFPPHSNIHETTSEQVVISGLTAFTWYHIHVHALYEGNCGTNIIIIRTRTTGSCLE